MEYFLSIILTSAIVFAMIIVINKKGKISARNIMYTQSEMHNLLKKYIPERFEEEPSSQLRKHASKNSIKVIVIDNEAYWVADNIFYTAELIKNSPDFINAKPVDTSKMSQQEIDKMMFVLDNLKGGRE